VKTKIKPKCQEIHWDDSSLKHFIWPVGSEGEKHLDDDPPASSLGLKHIDLLMPVFHAELLADVVSVKSYFSTKEALSGFGHRLCTIGQ
jgi:hypothetical protein